MVSALDQAKRALVALLRTLAAAYACSVKVARDSADAEVRTAYRAVSRKVHPDRPTGSAADQKRLNAAHDKWQALLKAAPGRGLKKGYKWLPRAQKRQYSDDDKKKRLAFAKKVIRLGAKGLKGTMSMAMDVAMAMS